MFHGSVGVFLDSFNPDFFFISLATAIGISNFYASKVLVVR